MLNQLSDLWQTRYDMSGFVPLAQPQKQVWVVDSNNVAKEFDKLASQEKDMPMFTMTNLTLQRSDNLVFLSIQLKRKLGKELLTTYLPTSLLLIITFASSFFKRTFFGD